ncbi:hypothetical protein LTR87_011338 [Friedmanniomyces endolithicus]|nr:hypothetical protein LTR87_011338 [Friedmanniomyces endolithicus]
MSPPNAKKRSSSSSHHSGRRQRLEENGIHMRTSGLLQSASKKLCNDLLAGEHSLDQHPCYPIERTDDVLERIHGLNEARLQRDVTPWVVPSAENLFFSGQKQLDYMGEEIQAEWVRCEPMGVSRPKPDFTVGLRRTAFQDDELRKLENYATPQGPFYFTPDLCFPFLMCEAKTGRIGIDQADTQNMHSASIAVRAMFKLYHAAYGVDHEKTKMLSGQILTFSVSHNNRLVNLYGHYAIAGSINDKSAESLQFFRHDIAMFSLTMYDGRERYKAYKFIRSLYDKFGPEHLRRVRDAVGQMASPAQRTGLSFAASDIGLDREDSQRESGDTTSQEDSQFRTPGEPASVSLRKETRRVREQMDVLLQQLEQQRQDGRDQLEQQRKESRDQLEQQRKESRDKEEKMGRQLEQLVSMVAKLQDAKSTS